MAGHRLRHASRHDPGFSVAGPLATNLFLLAVAVPYQWQLTQRRSRHLLRPCASTWRRRWWRNCCAATRRPAASRASSTSPPDRRHGRLYQPGRALPVEEAARLTRDFLDCLTGPVIGKLGTLDKYTGDGLVAFWGAPLPIADHADLALDAAREILRRVRAFQRARQQAGHAPLRVRIGIESGAAMAGDFGTSFRSIYTAVGDSVNTASRLEQAARDFPHDVIIGAGTVERRAATAFILLGERRLRGKENAGAWLELAITPVRTGPCGRGRAAVQRNRAALRAPGLASWKSSSGYRERGCIPTMRKQERMCVLGRARLRHQRQPRRQQRLFQHGRRRQLHRLGRWRRLPAEGRPLHACCRCDYSRTPERRDTLGFAQLRARRHDDVHRSKTPSSLLLGVEQPWGNWAAGAAARPPPLGACSWTATTTNARRSCNCGRRRRWQLSRANWTGR
jgi:class 3 adenylate cyclase